MMRNDEKGAVAVLVSVMLVLLVVCVALVVDLGHIHNVKVQLQRAVDAAALAGAQQLPDAVRADGTAVKVAGLNQVDNETLSDAIAAGTVALTVDFGKWDLSEEAFGQPASVRYNSLGPVPPPPLSDTPNAVAVTATREVDHIFFWFLPSTTVTTDAIAFREELFPVVPFALISCLPTGTGANCQAPDFGQNVCNVKLYKFTNEPQDTAGWTPLIWDNLGANQMGDFIEPGGYIPFNEVIYGGDPEEKAGGLEYTAIVSATPDDVPIPADFSPLDLETGAPACGRDNFTKHPDTSVDCGLGGDLELVDGVQINDPLDFARDHSALPRWFQSQFWDLITMTPAGSDKGYLCPDQSQTVLKKLYDASKTFDPLASPTTFDNLDDDPDLVAAGLPISIPAAFRDGRFARFIEVDNQGIYKINQGEILRYAGYPAVLGNTGQITSLINKFLDREDIQDSSGNLMTDKNPPFTNGFTPPSYGNGETLRLIIPVIYAGSCEEFQHLGTQNKSKLYYTGTASLLITRVFSTGKNECIGSASPVLADSTNTNIPCNVIDFDVPLSGDSFACPVPGKKPPKGFEGLIRQPGGGDEIGPQARIYLVE